MSFILKNNGDISFGEFPALSDFGIINGCSSRLNGESVIAEGGLNLALHVGDEPGLVLRNRKRYAQALNVESKSFTTCEQVHGTKVAVVTETMVGSGALDFAQSIKGVDALITSLRQVPLLLFYADCVPILLADVKVGVVGLAHAGWRGSVGNIAAKTVERMQEYYGSRPVDIIAAIGPSIGKCCYEVDDVVLTAGGEYRNCFIPKSNGKYQLDLWKMNHLQLEMAGLKTSHIHCAQTCTSENKDKFFSYRAEAGKTGRMGVCICRK